MAAGSLSKMLIQVYFRNSHTQNRWSDFSNEIKSHLNPKFKNPPDTKYKFKLKIFNWISFNDYFVC